MIDHAPIYLDYHATTPVLPEVLAAMLPYFSEHFGNAASRSHAFGWRAAEAVEIARRQVAALLDVAADDIYFTSGSTEGMNMLLRGLAPALATRGRHLVSVTTEHPAGLDPLYYLSRQGYEVTFVQVETDGRLDPDRFAAALRPDTALASVMWANNETGVIHPMAEIAARCRAQGVWLISDATQAAGKIPVHPLAMGVHALVLSAHKIYGPKGAGAVYLHPDLRRWKPEPLLLGGGHERGLRSGTHNVPGIVGLGAAADLRQRVMDVEMPRVAALRDEFETAVLGACDEVSVNGHVVDRLPTVTNLLVRHTDSQAVMTRFRSRLAISSGSACSSADPEPSHVLQAMGLRPAEAKASYRISLGDPVTADDIAAAARIFVDAVEAYRAESPVWQMFRQGIDLSDL